MKPDYSYQPGLVAEVKKYWASGESIVVLAGAPCAGKTKMACDLIQEHLRTTDTDVVIFTEGQIFLRQQFVDAAEGLFTFGVLSKNSKKVGPQRVHIALPHNTRIHNYSWPRKIGLLVVDEAHNFYPVLDGMITKFISRTKPEKQLLLTGTPSHFIQKKLPIVAVSLLELVDRKVAADIKSVIATTNHYRFTRKDYSAATQELKETVKIPEAQTISVLDDLLVEVHKRLLSITRAFPEYHQHLKGVAPNWPRVLSSLKKTMFVCHSQVQTQDVLRYFRSQNVNVVASTSSYDHDAVEIDKFVNDPNVRVLIVVKRCTLGFDFSELASVIDLTGSLNPNILFQMMCRLTRPSGTRKLFLKVCPEPLWSINYITMSFVVALADMRYYLAYSGGRYRDRIPLPKKVKELVEGTKRNHPQRPPQKLPELLTFTMLRAYREGTVYGEKAYTTFERVRSLLDGRTPDDDMMELFLAFGTKKWNAVRSKFA